MCVCARAATNPIQTLLRVSARVRECRLALQGLDANSRMAQIPVYWTSETGLARCRVQLAMTSPFENCGENAMNRVYGVCFDCQFLHPCFARSHPCCSQSSKEDFEDSPRGERSDAPVQELPKPKFGKRTYQRLAGAWSDMRQPTQLRQNMWVAVESLCGLPCCFGVTIRDLQALAMELAWDYPRGIAAIHLDRCKTLVFSPDDGPSVARVESALAWLRQFEGSSLGLAMRQNGDKFELGLVDVLFMPGQSTPGARRRRLFVAAVAGVVCSTRHS